MIFGNPYTFGVMFNSVSCWNEKNIEENYSCFSLCVYAGLFPNTLEKSNINMCLKELTELLRKIPDNVELYEMSAEKAIKTMYQITYPEDKERCDEYNYLISPTELIELGSFVFAVRNKGKIRVLASKLEYNSESSTRILDNITVTEIKIPQDEMEELMANLDTAVNEIHEDINGIKKDM